MEIQDGAIVRRDEAPTGGQYRKDTRGSDGNAQGRQARKDPIKLGSKDGMLIIARRISSQPLLMWAILFWCDERKLRGIR